MLLNFSKLKFSKRFLFGLGFFLIFIFIFKTTNNLNVLPTTCPFRLLTGLPCPGCGLTRSIGYLALGDFQLSIAHNPFGSFLLSYFFSFIFFPKYLLLFLTKVNSWIKESNKLIQAILYIAPVFFLWLWNITRWDNFLY